jgi:large subunit ribosomal protein L4
MMDLPTYNHAGEQVGQVQVDEQLLGGEVRPQLLKQAYVRFHANRRLGTAKTNARRGDKKANILVGGGRAHGPRPHSWRKAMPRKMRRLANRNALLAKLVDGEIKLIDGLSYDKPSTKQVTQLMQNLGLDRSTLLALDDTRGNEGLSARNVADITLTQIDRLNAFDVLNHRYLVADKASFEAYLQRLAEQAAPSKQEAA